MAKTRRKKKRTHGKLKVDETAEQGEKVPRSFVISRGKLPVLLRNLRYDLRKLMSPYTAARLKESTRNSLKDFVHVAGPLGVTHFLILSNTTTAPYLRIGRCPHGPTLTFKIHSYALAADIARSQMRPRAPLSIFLTPPLVVLNGFTGEEHLKLIQIMFQNIFPVINVNNVKLASCQRVLLLNYDKKSRRIDFRHYSISAQPVGVSRNIRKLVQRKALPNLSGLNDVSEFVMRSGYGSESEVEDENAKVQLADEYGKGNHASQQSSVKLHEVGPRMTLQLVKVEEGLCSGAVMFHEYVKKTPEQIAELRENKEKREALRKQRKAEQEANVRKKEAQKTSRRRPPKETVPDPVDDADPESDADDGLLEEKDYDDEDWYRKEVGEEPDPSFSSGVSGRGRGRGRPRGKFAQRFQGTKRKQMGASSSEGASRSFKIDPVGVDDDRKKRKEGGKRSHESRSDGAGKHKKRDEGSDFKRRKRMG